MLGIKTRSPEITRDVREKDVRRERNDTDLPFDKTTLSTEDTKAYLEDVGKLGWLTDKSRPDIAVAVNKLQRRSSTPRIEDQEAVKQLIRYIKGTMNLGILLGKDSTGLAGYVDASYQDCEDGKSTEGFIFFYAGGPVSWSSRKEDIVARSSTTAEYVAYDAAI
ncbi:uncharacterized protein N7479_001748 [Penicillium vulpinum]|uniref:Reverse transcriptase Ty1/copia-type domain-containing protein n=1 Tax=Penicillium vulpinum TaxID=29845 RepID=A0A1V6QY84_9EURO|nr:uncharacterized protein N7479_001748 [Penicillium vulpinum]KAJ5971830.1 hypothetical protein N7479_001748 [Penicillium vulpinum]OQD94155.1 hypothetical protein PENVUL_c153G01931 [Penicillium vulpinum]